MKTMKFDKAHLTRGLPKTGCITEGRTGDDAEYQAGWWIGRTAANNKTRFIAGAIGDDEIVVDNATGLMWPAVGNKEGGNNGDKLSLPEALVYANGLTFAGFSDWRLPNIYELFSLVNFGEDLTKVYLDFFDNIRGDKYWSSTHIYDSADAYMYVDFISGHVATQSVGIPQYLLCVRGGL